MADGLNRVTLIGNLGQDPDLRFTQAGQPVMSMRVATTESYVDRNQERQQRTEWHSVVLWGKRAEALAKFLSKGSKVCIEGRLQTRSWETKEGAKRYTTEIVSSNILLLGGRGKGGSQDSAPPPGASGEQGGDDFGDDDIPF